MIKTILAVTLNLWGLPDVGYKVLAPLREQRLTEICRRLKTQANDPKGYDLVLLQEVWLAEDRAKLKDCGYPHVLDLNDPDRYLDSGLLTLSKFPIFDSKRLTYAMPEASGDEADGESWVRKGATIARVLVPGMESGAWVANTHLVSYYGEPDRYGEARRRQFRQFHQWVTATSEGNPLIVGGDWNFTPQQTQWSEVTKWFSDFVFAPSHELACTICPPNTFHSQNEGKVDHLSGSSAFDAIVGKPAFVETFKVDEVELSVSDHIGWSTEFRLR